MSIQLDFFKELSETEILNERIRMLEKSMDKQRKALFARNGQLEKNYIDLHQRLEIIERGICQNRFSFKEDEFVYAS